jgi:hypothetical protein
MNSRKSNFIRTVLSSKVIIRNVVVVLILSVCLAVISLSEASADLIYAQPCSNTMFGASANCTGYGICDVGDARDGNISLNASASGSCSNIFYKNKIKVEGTVGGLGLQSTAETSAGPAEVQVGAYLTIGWWCDGTDTFSQVNGASCSEVSCSPTGNPPCTNWTWDSYYCQYNCVFDGGSGGCGTGQFPPECEPPDHTNLDSCCCENGNGVCTSSPILIDVEGNGFSLSDLTTGIQFDLNADGVAERVSWTTPTSDDAWLVLDRNANGRIDNGTELFGNYSPQPSISGKQKNGFLALTLFDKIENGGDGDGNITIADSAYTALRLWRDSNHNGVSEFSEFESLQEAGLSSIALSYNTSRRIDRYGNRFRYRAKIADDRNAQLGRWAWDVFLVSVP